MERPTILCATDLGDDGRRAVELAAAFGRALSGQVLLVHVTDVASDADPLGPPGATPGGADALRHRVQEKLSDLAGRLEAERARCESLGVECAAALVEGRPSEAIEREAVDRRASLIVLGRRERDGDGGFVGPTLHHVVRHGHCPVAVAPPRGASPTTLENGRWVVGVDFGRQSRVALGAALALVRASGGDLVLAQVTEPAGGEELTYEERTPAQILREESNRQRLRTLERMAEEAGPNVRATMRVCLDRPADALCEVAREAQATGIVVGTHGRTGLGRFFLGSVADRLLRRSSLPVLVVRDTPPQVAPWFPMPDAGPLALSANHLLVGVDFSDASRHALELARHLSARMQVAVDVVHVHEVPTDVRRGLVAKMTRPTPSADEATVARLRQALSSLVAEVFEADAQTVGVHVAVGRPVPEILEAARARKADLVVLGTTGRAGVERMLLGSVAESLVRSSPVPVLTVH